MNNHRETWVPAERGRGSPRPRPTLLGAIRDHPAPIVIWTVSLALTAAMLGLAAIVGGPPAPAPFATPAIAAPPAPPKVKVGDVLRAEDPFYTHVPLFWDRDAYDDYVAMRRAGVADRSLFRLTSKTAATMKEGTTLRVVILVDGGAGVVVESLPRGTTRASSRGETMAWSTSGTRTGDADHPRPAPVRCRGGVVSRAATWWTKTRGPLAIPKSGSPNG